MGKFWIGCLRLNTSALSPYNRFRNLTSRIRVFVAGYCFRDKRPSLFLDLLIRVVASVSLGSCKWTPGKTEKPESREIAPRLLCEISTCLKPEPKPSYGEEGVGESPFPPTMMATTMMITVQELQELVDFLTCKYILYVLRRDAIDSLR